MDVALLRKLAAVELGKRALTELAEEPDELDSFDRVLLYKAAQAEDRPLFEIAMRLPGDAINNYTALGGTFKTASGGLTPDQADDLADAGNIARVGTLGGVLGAGIGAMRSPSHILPGAGYGALYGAATGFMTRPVHQALEARRAAQAQGDEILKQAFGQPMFSAAPAPDPSQQTGLQPPSPSAGSSGPKGPTSSSGPQGGGGTSSQGTPKMTVSEPSVPGASAGGGMG